MGLNGQLDVCCGSLATRQDQTLSYANVHWDHMEPLKGVNWSKQELKWRGIVGLIHQGDILSKQKTTNKNKKNTRANIYI